jgi:hypothetical protein
MTARATENANRSKRQKRRKPTKTHRTQSRAQNSGARANSCNGSRAVQRQHPPQPNGQNRGHHHESLRRSPANGPRRNARCLRQRVAISLRKQLLEAQAGGRGQTHLPVPLGRLRGAKAPRKNHQSLPAKTAQRHGYAEREGRIDRSRSNASPLLAAAVLRSGNQVGYSGGTRAIALRQRKRHTQALPGLTATQPEAISDTNGSDADAVFAALEDGFLLAPGELNRMNGFDPEGRA